MICLSDLREFASVPVDPRDSRYAEPLARDAQQLRQQLAAGDRVILLGSIATDKYGSILTAILGEHLQFPSEFVGRGDMSRGRLLLRCVAEGRELTYVPLGGATRRGRRPESLSPRNQVSAN
jgi:hypothetical protein